MSRNERFQDATVEELAQGCRHSDGGWQCLFCQAVYGDDEIHPVDGRFFTAEGAVRRHVAQAHGPAFQALLGQERKYLTLTDHQAHILDLLFAGRSDRDAAAEAGSSPAAIRNLRFQLREREKQAKAFLALMAAFRAGQGKESSEEKHLPIPPGATMDDDRFRMTAGEEAAALKASFGPDGRLRHFPAREKRKIAVLRHLAQRFQPGQRYTEREVNERIGYEDFATVRRYLIEYGFLARSTDCSQYWRKESNDD